MAKDKDSKKGRDLDTVKKKADFSLLDDETKAKLRAKAQERIAEQLREEAEDAFLEQAMREERRKHSAYVHELPMDDVEITIDLPEFAPSIRLNSRDYFSNFSYTVPRHVYNSMIDIMARAWEHQSEIEGRPRHYFQKKRNAVIGKRA